MVSEKPEPNSRPVKKVSFSEEKSVSIYEFKEAHREEGDNEKEGLYEYDDKELVAKEIEKNKLHNSLVGFLVDKRGKKYEESEELVKRALSEEEDEILLREGLIIEYLEAADQKKEKTQKTSDIVLMNLEHTTVKDLVNNQGKTYEEAEAIAKELVKSTRTQIETTNAQPKTENSSEKGFWETMLSQQREENEREDSCPCRIM